MPVEPAVVAAGEEGADPGRLTVAAGLAVDGDAVAGAAASCSS